jgi:hypothetical protein
LPSARSGETQTERSVSYKSAGTQHREQRARCTRESRRLLFRQSKRAMRGRRPSEICFFCPESLYQDLVRALSKRLGRTRGAIERDFSRLVELLLTRLVDRPVLLAELVDRPTVRSARPARPTPRAKAKSAGRSGKVAAGRTKKRHLRARANAKPAATRRG